MNRSLSFSAGVLLFAIGWSEVLNIWQSGSLRPPTVGGVVIFLIYALLGWLCYLLGARGSRRSRPAILVAVMGAIVMAVQCGVVWYVTSNMDDMPELPRSLLSGEVATGRLLGFIAWFSLPFIVGSLISGRVGGRSID